eukprot:6288056-Pyramimonas_sp.AAC.1
MDSEPIHPFNVVPEFASITQLEVMLADSSSKVPKSQVLDITTENCNKPASNWRVRGDFSTAFRSSPKLR